MPAPTPPKPQSGSPGSLIWGEGSTGTDQIAVKAAIELLHIPSRARALRAEPLPPHALAILRIAAGEEDAIESAVSGLGRPRAEVEQACTFFIEQILLAPGSDSYRVLGATSSASAGELRRNMALLLRWLHPDLDRKAARTALAPRVTKAWDDLKTPERRGEFDAARTGSLKRSRRAPRPLYDRPPGARPPLAPRDGVVMRVLRFLLRRT